MCMEDYHRMEDCINWAIMDKGCSLDDYICYEMYCTEQHNMFSICEEMCEGAGDLFFSNFQMMCFKFGGKVSASF